MAPLRHLKLLYKLYPAWKVIAEYRYALELAKKYQCRRVLDVGCGRGNLGKVLLEGHPYLQLYVGVDIYDIFMEVEDPRINFIVLDAKNPPLMNRFDCIFFVNSVFYIGLDSLEKYRNLGNLIAIVDIDPSYPHIWVVDRFESFFKGMRRSREGLITLLRNKGFDIIEEGGGATYYVVASCNRLLHRQ